MMPIDLIPVSAPAYKENLAALGYKVLTSIRRNAFAVGFLAVLLFFVGANVYSYMVMPDEPRIADGFEQCGSPSIYICMVVLLVCPICFGRASLQTY